MGNNIKLYRTKQNMTLIQLSKKCGLSAGYLCHLEKGSRENPSRKSMESISNALNENIYHVFYLVLW